MQAKDTKQQHTAEPFALPLRAEKHGNFTGYIDVYDANGNEAVRDIDEDQARRIVACVNACAGFDDPETFIQETMAERVRFMQQRDKLLAALKDCAKDMECWADYASEYFQEKHRLQDDIAKYNALIAEIEAAK